uniref:Coiled-coil domain-containing protein 12 n=1 Tax=Plectus sambesii TaxID=2011161 RepID=A0A914XGY0_9BILA
MTDDSEIVVDEDEQNEESASTLESEAKRRKERLLALKRKLVAGSAPADEDEELAAAEKEKQELKRTVFRSYQPESEVLAVSKLPAPTQTFAVEEELQEQLTAAVDTSVIDEVDLTTLAPRKADWDLKRDVSKRLEKLERRTQRAIADLIRERLASGKQDLLLSAVNSGIQAEREQAEHDSDDD